MSKHREYSISFKDNRPRVRIVAAQVLTPQRSIFNDDGNDHYLFHAYDDVEKQEGWHLVAAVHRDDVRSVELVDSQHLGWDSF